MKSDKLIDYNENEINYLKESYKKIEDKILFMAYHDSLTGLPNKNYFSMEINRLLAKSEKGTVILIDIDNFKDINDSFGYHYGDILLKIISELLQRCTQDKGTVLKMNGDEFLILLPGITNMAAIKSLCHSVMENFKNPFEIMDINTYSSVSMGIAIFDSSCSDETEILRNSDLALNYAKNEGKGEFIFYDSRMENLILKRKKIENELLKALDNNEIELYYQPQIDITNNKVRGFEALLRWNSPELGWVPPEEFITVAEETGLMYKIGEWVLKEACRQAKEWKDKGISFETISVNVSPKQIKNHYFTKLIKDVLSETDLKKEFLEIEITESTLIKSIEEKSKLLEDLINEGIQVSLDDFGKGYSSLNYLTKIPINTIKIDKSFIDKICNDYKTYLIVECIVELSNKLKYRVIAEGVENIEQVKLLKAIGCSYIQGYYYGKPLPAKLVYESFAGRK